MCWGHGWGPRSCCGVLAFVFPVGACLVAVLVCFSAAAVRVCACSQGWQKRTDKPCFETEALTWNGNGPRDHQLQALAQAYTRSRFQNKQPVVFGVEPAPRCGTQQATALPNRRGQQTLPTGAVWNGQHTQTTETRGTKPRKPSLFSDADSFDNLLVHLSLIHI